MRNFFRSARLSAVCLMGLAHLSPLAAQSSVETISRGVTYEGMPLFRRGVGFEIATRPDWCVRPRSVRHARKYLRFCVLTARTIENEYLWNPFNVRKGADELHRLADYVCRMARAETLGTSAANLRPSSGPLVIR